MYPNYTQKYIWARKFWLFIWALDVQRPGVERPDVQDVQNEGRRQPYTLYQRGKHLFDAIPNIALSINNASGISGHAMPSYDKLREMIIVRWHRKSSFAK
jgi:hypothetical protein